LDISKRFPSWKEITPVYAVIVLMVYGWTLSWFNYTLPGWMYFLNVNTIVGVFAYSMFTNFLESLVVALGVVLLGVILPRKWFADAFVARGSALTIFLLALMMYIANQFNTKEYYPGALLHWSVAILAAILIVVYFLGRVNFIRKLIELFADRAIIFLYISIPVSLASIVIVLIRNFF